MTDKSLSDLIAAANGEESGSAAPGDATPADIGNAIVAALAGRKASDKEVPSLAVQAAAIVDLVRLSEEAIDPPWRPGQPVRWAPRCGPFTASANEKFVFFWWRQLDPEDAVDQAILRQHEHILTSMPDADCLIGYMKEPDMFVFEPAAMSMLVVDDRDLGAAPTPAEG